MVLGFEKLFKLSIMVVGVVSPKETKRKKNGSLNFLELKCSALPYNFVFIYNKKATFRSISLVFETEKYIFRLWKLKDFHFSL